MRLLLEDLRYWLMIARMDARNLRLSLARVRRIVAAMRAERLDRKPP